MKPCIMGFMKNKITRIKVLVDFVDLNGGTKMIPVADLEVGHRLVRIDGVFPVVKIEEFENSRRVHFEVRDGNVWRMAFFRHRTVRVAE